MTLPWLIGAELAIYRSALAATATTATVTTTTTTTAAAAAAAVATTVTTAVTAAAAINAAAAKPPWRRLTQSLGHRGSGRDLAVVFGQPVVALGL